MKIQCHRVTVKPIWGLGREVGSQTSWELFQSLHIFFEIINFIDVLAQSCVFACVFTDCAHCFHIISKRKWSCILLFFVIIKFSFSSWFIILKPISILPNQPTWHNYCLSSFLFFQLTCPISAYVLSPPWDDFQHCYSYTCHCFRPGMLGNAASTSLTSPSSWRHLLFFPNLRKDPVTYSIMIYSTT